MPRYIQLPVRTSSVDLLQLAVNYLSQRIPGWRVNEAELDYIMLQTNSMLAAELATIASDVPAAIFRWFGATMMDLPPEDASVASTTSTWTAIDDLGHTIPIGTVVGIESADGGLQSFAVANEVTIAPGSTATADGEVVLIATEPGSASSGLGNDGIEAQLIDPLDWMDTVFLNGMTIGGVDDELDDAYLDRLRAELQLMSPRPILANDFAVLARDVPGVWRATAIDGYNPMHNLLTANEASIETDITGWAALTNCAIVQSGTVSADGSQSARMTASAAGDMTARLVTGRPVTFGQRVTAGVKMRAGTTARGCQVTLRFLNGSGTVIGSVVGTAVADTNSGWTDVTVTGLAPEGTATVKLDISVISPGAGEQHYFDQAYIRKNALTGFVAGGTTEMNTERTVTVAAQDEAGGAAGPAVKAEVASTLDALREVNFVVNVVDPTFTNVNVLYDVQAVPGQDPVSVKTAVDAAIAEYLDPIQWGLPEDGDPRVWNNRTILRFTDLVHVVHRVPGVDYLYTLNLAIDPGSLGISDVTLPGIAPLPHLNTLIGTVHG